MSLYMLDTDVSSYLIRGDHPEVTAEFVKNYQNVCISVITVAELKYGAIRRKNQQLTQKVQSFCALVQCIDWTYDMALEYAKLRTELEEKGTPIGSMDMLIAASAIIEDAILVTNNMEHFSRIKKLKPVPCSDQD